MMSIIDRLSTIEVDKRAEPIGSERFIELAGEATELSRLVFRWGALQEELARQAAGSILGGPPGRPIKDVAPRPLHRVLTAWREAEFRLHAAQPDSEERAAAVDDLEALREEYRQMHDRLMADVSGGG